MPTGAARRERRDGEGWVVVTLEAVNAAVDTSRVSCNRFARFAIAFGPDTHRQRERHVHKHRRPAQCQPHKPVLAAQPRHSAAATPARKQTKSRAQHGAVMAWTRCAADLLPAFRGRGGKTQRATLLAGQSGVRIQMCAGRARRGRLRGGDYACMCAGHTGWHAWRYGTDILHTLQLFFGRFLRSHLHDTSGNRGAVMFTS